VNLESGDKSALFASWAKLIHSYHLEVPVIFFLEMYKPLSGLAHQALIGASPLVKPLLGAALCEKLLLLLESRQDVEQLICAVENQALGKT
jgi:hypothetical protein